MQFRSSYFSCAKRIIHIKLVRQRQCIHFFHKAGACLNALWEKTVFCVFALIAVQMLLHCRKIELLFHLRPRYRLHSNPSKHFWGLIPPSASLTSRDNYNIYCLLLAELHSVFSLLSRGEKAVSKQTASLRCSKAPADLIHYRSLHFRRPPLYSRLFCLPFLKEHHQHRFPFSSLSITDSDNHLCSWTAQFFWVLSLAAIFEVWQVPWV